MMNLEIKKMAKNFKQSLRNHYGERLQRLILLGATELIMLFLMLCRH